RYGIIDRCKELVEAGYDVRQPDKENVTLLHWASINNRKELVKYYISKGAIIDQLGGDLNSTPIHWAIRQGHLPMVILLMKYGADPTLLDGEGYSGLHLAVQFQHMPILAYLLSKGQNIDTPNLHGQTPLMLAAHKVIGPEPTNFLLKFNASVTAVDKLHRNTALHWAVLSKNENAAHFLLEAGANPDAENAKGETPIDLAHQFRNPLMLHILTHVKKERSHIQNPFVKRLQKYKFCFMTALSVVMLWTAGYIADLNTESWLLKGTLFACLFAIVNLATRWLINVHIQNLVVPAFLLASILLMFLTWFIWFLPDILLISNTCTVKYAIFQITFCLSIVGLLYYFYKTWASDPGYIKSSLEEKKKTVITLAEAGFLDFGLLCGSCLVRRPARSLHCFLCDCCVAKHDHHSIWTNNCIGAGNHRYFVAFLFFLSLVLGWMFYGTAVYWSSHCTFNYSNEGIWGVLIQVVTCSPWVLYIFIIVCVHATWSSLMLLSQIYQVCDYWKYFFNLAYFSVFYNF
ncbi:ZDH13 Palmitoyltransferase, partial [Polypterus senegalus]|nr:ZDH13 Palmitoyltransferase [Polypterus senegalus]